MLTAIVSRSDGVIMVYTDDLIIGLREDEELWASRFGGCRGGWL